jgi:hypothetical protein
MRNKYLITGYLIKRLLKERIPKEGNCKHGTPSTKENMLSSRGSVIMEVQQDQEQSKATENKKLSQDAHKLENSQTKVRSNNDECDEAQLPQTKSSEYPSEGDTNDEREFTEVKRRNKRKKQVSSNRRAEDENNSEKEGTGTATKARSNAENSREEGKVWWRRGIIGTRVEPNEGQTILQASTRMAWRYVGKLDTKTRKEGNGINGEIECDKLNSLSRNKAFKIGFPSSFAGTVDKEEFWPKGILIRPFRFRRWEDKQGIELPQCQ